jgi:predicted DNA-binding transcriptional regulator AlpA
VIEGERPVTAREMAPHVGISPAVLLRWARQGKVPSKKLPSGAVRFYHSEMDTWLDGCSRGGAVGRGVPTASSDRAAAGTYIPAEFSSPTARPPSAAADSTEEEDHAT